MRFLLIGGTGFIGAHVSRALADAGHDVTVFHRGRTAPPHGTREIVGNRAELASQADRLHASAPDVVVDFILSSGRQARELVAIFRGRAQRVVAISSCDVYRACGVLHGTEPGPLQPLPLTESSELRSSGQTYSAEALERARRVYPWIDDEYDKIPVEEEILGDEELRGTVLRLPMVYGPGDPLHRLAPLLMRMASQPDVVAFEEKLAAWRSPRGYVENVAAAVALAATADRAAGGTYNVAEAESLSEIEWAQRIASVVGWMGRFEAVPADRAPAEARMPGNLDQHWVVDTSRIRAELGYREPVAREEAIKRAVEWERAARPA
jgi:nucleoside-diphosphate-sugar epimerase